MQQRPIPAMSIQDSRPVGVQWILAAWCMLVVLGFLTIRINGALGANNQVSAVRAIFTSVNASTLTGFTQTFAKPSDFRLPVQYVLAMQTLMGTLLSLVTGGILLSKVLGRSHKESDITAVAMLLLALSLVIGAALGETAGWSAITGLSALGNSGLIFENPPAPQSTSLIAAFLPLAWIGSLGTVVVLDLWKWLTKKETLHNSTIRMIVVSTGLYALSTLLLLFLTHEFFRENDDGGMTLDFRGFSGHLIDATRISLNAPALGFPIDLVSKWPFVVQWVAMAMMVIGQGTIGTNGGLGLALLATLPKSTRTLLLRSLTIFWGTAFVVLLIILQTEPTLSPDRALMIVISAAVNSGLSHEPIGITGHISLWSLSMLMVVGRLLPLGMLAWMNFDTNKTS